MGQVHVQDVTIEEAVQSSNLIVVAVLREAEDVQEPVLDETWDGQPAPPFSWRKHHVLVQEVLLGDRGQLGATIGVSPADLDWERDLHRRYYADGVSSSPLMRRYDGLAMDDQPRILFLDARGTSTQFAIAGAVEGLDRRDEVLGLIASRAPVVVVDGRPSVRAFPWLAILFVVAVAVAVFAML